MTRQPREGGVPSGPVVFGAGWFRLGWGPVAGAVACKLERTRARFGAHTPPTLPPRGTPHPPDAIDATGPLPTLIAFKKARLATLAATQPG